MENQTAKIAKLDFLVSEVGEFVEKEKSNKKNQSAKENVKKHRGKSLLELLRREKIKEMRGFEI